MLALQRVGVLLLHRCHQAPATAERLFTLAKHTEVTVTKPHDTTCEREDVPNTR